RRAGYVLERRRDVLERLSAEQARDEAPMTNNDDGTLWEESEWRVQELFPSGWGAVKSSHDRNEALARMANLRARYTDTQYRLVRRTTTETVDTESDQ
ncbi:hypothetical protein, partial [Streptomyces triculaminicus]|uniref:hypothetical protein n=1 Tax=Streptomyces triculaminicus TaxID=2816232 RepID=UPI003799AB0A